MKKLKMLGFYAFIFVLNFNCFAQRQQSFTLGVGAGATTNYSSEGVGLSYNFGYQLDLWKNRWRLCPTISTGNFTNSFILDATNSFFNSTNFKLFTNFDIVKYKSSNIFIGAGYALNKVKGLNNGDKNYFKEVNHGYGFCLGYRYCNIAKRFGFEIKLFEALIEPSNQEIFTDIQILTPNLIINLK